MSKTNKRNRNRRNRKGRTLVASRDRSGQGIGHPGKIGYTHTDKRKEASRKACRGGDQ